MDQRDCPEGWANDGFLVFTSSAARCTVPVAAFATLTGLLLCYRLASVLASGYVWRSIQHKKTGSHQDRLPVVPFTMAVDFVVILLVFTLFLTNTFSSSTGMPIVLLWVWTLTSTPLAVLQTKKMFTLATKLRARMKRQEHLQLSMSQRLVLMAQGLGYLAQAACALMGVIQPQYSVEAARGCFACLGLIITLNFLGIGIQYQRCITELTEYGGELPKTKTDWTVAVVRRLRWQQVAYVMAVPMVLTPVVYFLVTDEFYWWLLLVLFLTSCLISTGVIMAIWRPKLPFASGAVATASAGSPKSPLANRSNGTVLPSIE
ncbi:hypothetical protein BASA81_005153 [Batrachochytrium salamandrivorans]|nr:hypothetical protein BASA81_005153 [Batrachochytrium salamandrivorans]